MKLNSRLAEVPSRRPRRSSGEIQSILRRHRGSGLSLLAFARQHGLCYASLLRWRRRFDAGARPETVIAAEPPDRPHAPAFVPVELEAGLPPAGFVLKWAAGRTLHIPPDFDPDRLRRLLEVLGVRP